MPLFFMVSGFLTYKAYRWGDFLPFVRKRAVRLLVPWASTIWLAYLVRGAVGYWFLLCLFQVSVVAFPLIVLAEKANAKGRLAVDVSAACAAYVLLRMLHAQDWDFCGISLGRFVGAFVPFIAGVLLRKHKSLYEAVIGSPRSYTIASALFAGVFLCRYFAGHGGFPDGVYRHGGTVLALAGSFMAFHVFSVGRAFPALTRALSRLGRKTLPVYILHVMFVLQIHPVGDFILRQGAVTSIVLQITYSAGVSSVAVGLSLLLYRMLSASPLFRRLLFGE